MDVTDIPLDRKDEAVDVVFDAFADYPVMRFIVGMEGEPYRRRARRMVDFFVTARLLNGEVVMGAVEEGSLVGVATVTPPGERPRSAAIAPLRQALWDDLGAEALARYEALTAVWQTFTMAEPHHHLNMLGVRRSHQRRGVGRRLLDALHERAERAPDSGGVSLTTEDPANVPLYEHVGYRVTGHVRVAPALETWAFFRPNAAR